MRVSRTRFSKRRSKRRTEFPIVAVVQKKRKAKWLTSQSFSVLDKEDRKRVKDSSSSSVNFAFGSSSETESKTMPSQIASSEKGQNSFFSKENQLSARQKGDSSQDLQSKSFTKMHGFASQNLSMESQGFAKQKLSPKMQVQKKSRATIDYKNVALLRNLITAEGKILPRRINKLTAKQQRYVQKAIKSARVMGLLPFINKSRPF